ncbi:hypothetical protein [Marinobacterium aestuariivivens]|uniref:Phytase-like domain-containing protein n=1 Tax=Marinobacterium aestuariivivens TaxID=1698799 RepID=A0ABW2A824_9GAMM
MKHATRRWFCAGILAPALLAGCASVELSGPEAGGLRGDIAVRRLALLPEGVLETSGLALVEGRLWTINDSGDGAVIYQLDEAATGIEKQLFLEGARNVDWEALAFDGRALYIADCGNNRGDRPVLDLYRVPVEFLAAPDRSRIGYRRMRFSYGERLEVRASRDHDYDCEALGAVGDELWLFSKNRGDGHSRLYRLDSHAAEQEVFSSARYPVDGLVTAADYDPGSRRLVLLGYSRERMPGHSFLWLVPVLDASPDWSGARRYRLETYSQWEAISWDGPRRLLLTTERNPWGMRRSARSGWMRRASRCGLAGPPWPTIPGSGQKGPRQDAIN